MLYYSFSEKSLPHIQPVHSLITKDVKHKALPARQPFEGGERENGREEIINKINKSQPLTRISLAKKTPQLSRAPPPHPGCLSSQIDSAQTQETSTENHKCSARYHPQTQLRRCSYTTAAMGLVLAPIKIKINPPRLCSPRKHPPCSRCRCFTPGSSLQ